jgi:uracil phosphoribosyltransferase
VVSILRSGNAFLPEVFKIMPGITVGQILIQRNEETFNANHYYTKLPKDIEKKKVFDNVN